MKNITETTEVTLSVIMPAYNEGEHIYSNLLKCSQILSSFVRKYEIIAVNDGSTDKTLKEINRASKLDSHIIPAGYEKNHGKGYTVKYGAALAKGSYIAFLDSDLELDPKLLKSYLNIMAKGNFDIVIGSKMHPDSQINYPFSRKVMSYGYFLFSKMLFHYNIHDTQTGIKLFKNHVLKDIIKDLTTYGYAFDIELLATAYEKGYTIAEAPITLNYSRDDSSERRIGSKDVLNVFKDTLTIKKKMRKNKH